MAFLFALLNSVWSVALETSKYLLSLILIAGFTIQFNREKKLNLSGFIYSFKTILIPLGQYIVFGITFAGILNYFIKNTAVSSIILAVFLGISYFTFKKGLKYPKKFSKKNKIFFYIYSLILFSFLIASLILNTALMNSLVALLLFGTLFWEI